MDKFKFIKKIKKINPKLGMPLINRYLTIIEENNRRTSGTGFNIDENQAFNSSIGEAIERYSASSTLNAWENNEINIYSNIKSKNNMLDLTLIEKKKNVDQYLKNEDTWWVKCNSLHTSREYWLPHELIYLSNVPYSPIKESISTGLSVYTTREKAIESSLLEVIERDSFMLFWLFGNIKREIILENVMDEKIQKYKSISKDAGIKMRIFDITSDLNVPTVISVISREKEKGFYIGCASSLDYREAIISSINEGLSGFSIYYEKVHYYNNSIPEDEKNINSLDDHALYYICENKAGNKILKKFFSKVHNKININKLLCVGKNNFKNLLEELEIRGIEIYFKDITPPSVFSSEIYASRVYVPSLIELPINGLPYHNKRLISFLHKNNGEINNLAHPFP